MGARQTEALPCDYAAFSAAAITSAAIELDSSALQSAICIFASVNLHSV